LSPGAPSSENDPLITNNSASSEASSSSHEDTVTLNIDVDTGLIATESCVHVKSQTFKISESPTKLCGPEYHRLTPEYKKPSDKKPDHPDHPIDHLWWYVSAVGSTTQHRRDCAFFIAPHSWFGL